MQCVNVTIPVYNEEERLASAFPTLHRFLTKHCRFSFEVVIANNGSTDRSRIVAEELCSRFESVRVENLTEKGRGLALRHAWSTSEASILSYMDVDLATDLHALPPMVEALISGGFDIATGSRLLKRSLTNRSLKRDIISRVYNLVVRLLFRTHISDFQCGFKALTRQAADDLLPIVVDNGWFFDTELLLFAERFGYRVFDLPVRWRENTDSRVRILQTAIADLQGLFRVYNTFASGKYPARQRSSARVYETRETPASATSRECWSSQRRETL